MDQQTLAQMVRAKYPGAYNDLSDQDLEKAVKAKYPGTYDDIPTTTKQEAPKRPDGAPLHPLANFGEGVKQGLWKSGIALAELVNQGTSSVGLNKRIDPEVFEAARKDLATSHNAGQALGQAVEQIGELVIPSRTVTAAAMKLAKYAPRGLKILTRGAVEGAGQAGLATAQGNDPLVAGAVGGVAGTVAGATRAGRAAMVNPNSTEAAALEYVSSRGVPVDAGTMSGNAAIKGAKSLADKTFLGAAVAGKELQKEQKGLATLGEQLASKASPKPATPLSAGTDLISAGEKRIKDLDKTADTAYDALRNMETANTQTVVVGHQPSASGVVKSVPITKQMGFPVDLKTVKSSLRPLYDELREAMPIAQQEASFGLKALENIINGPDVQSASIVDKGLSAIKSIVRGASRPELRTTSQGLAAAAVKELDEAVKAAVSTGGKQATAALEAGRGATRLKYMAADVLDKLRTEPVGAFRQATQAGDSTVSQLRELSMLAPKEIPKLGRAFLDDMLTTATNEDTFKGAAAMATKWQNLGPETKKILYGRTPGLVQELDKFFIAAKRLAENPNPSGTGGLVSIGSQLGMFYFDPVLGVGTQLTGAAMSKLLRNPTAVRLMTQGMSAKPTSSVTTAALKQAIIRALSAKDEQ